MSCMNAEKPSRYPKMTRYVEARIADPTKSRFRCAIEAGYSEKTAVRPGDAIENRPNYRALMAKYAPADKVIRRLSESLNAEKVTHFAKDGKVIESKSDVDHSTRLAAVKIAAQMHGMLKEAAPVVNINVLAELLDIG